MYINKEDLPILNYLLTELVKPINSNGIDYSSLPIEYQLKFKDNNKKDTEFRKFANIFDKSNAGKFVQSKIGWALILPIANSHGFDFNKFYEKQIIKEKKEIYDYQISRIKAKTFIPILILGMFGGVYSFYSLLKDIGIINLNQNKEIHSNQENLETNNTTKNIEFEKSHDSIKDKIRK
ncbi:hypothetical protein [Psychroserpens damuponensis]|uniref:hypothetical protein n=1 Tax=Psychroserpens damuponensis TaxID=943936 RepID=UPI00059125BB|nr:hypothetical protein [Psychroserpens damuponensis]